MSDRYEIAKACLGAEAATTKAVGPATEFEATDGWLDYILKYTGDEPSMVESRDVAFAQADAVLALGSLADDPQAVERACIEAHGGLAWKRWNDEQRAMEMLQMQEVLRAAETGADK